MSIAELARNIAAKIADWWRDREDERLDELVGQDYRDVSDQASHSGITAYQLVSKARNSGRSA